ncbi:MAG: ATP phosphoribosyltransferase regulatory subunit [Oscillospiraceae bacterium]|jgi:ATP phosphoribosyltransferase regulatory subunit
MKRYDLITPEGTRDLLFEECLARREVEKKLVGIFSGFGYSEVVTPGIEFLDVFDKSGYFPQESLYKLADLKGRLITIRPDSTVPIARIVATRLKSSRLPLRLFYNQNIFSVNRSLTGRSDEIVQAGIELVGSASEMADFEVLSTAIQSLSAFDKGFRLEIGDIGFFRELVASLDVSDAEREEIRYLVEVKNYPSLNDILDRIGDNAVTRALKALPRLFGGEEIFEKAVSLFFDSKIDKILIKLREVYKKLCELGFKESITVDLGIVNRTDYYTGVVFRGYLQGYGEAVLSGGRYDKLISEFGYDIPAIGFGINVDAVATMLRRQNRSPKPSAVDLIIFAEQGFEMKALLIAQKCISDGKTVEMSLLSSLEETKKYALENNISKVMQVAAEIMETEVKGGAENE